VYAGAFQWPKAEEEFRAQAKLQPGNAEAAYRLGTALLEQGKVHEARAELVSADKLMPDMPETLYSLGKAASLDGDTAAAEKNWTRLLTIEKGVHSRRRRTSGWQLSIGSRERRKPRSVKCRNSNGYRAF